MNPEIKRRWLEALRSGGYSQGTGQLVRDFGQGEVFCCLGVLCDLAAKEGIVKKSGHSFVGNKDSEQLYLPVDVIEWAGVKVENPLVGEEGLETHLSQLNDKGTPFSTIADLIEKYL